MPAESPSPLSPESAGLPRRLGGFDATMLIVGDIIGVGIFTTTGLVADAFPHPVWLLLAWLAGGLLTLCGALTLAELGGALPHAGGEYVYLKHAYGRWVGFLNGWTYLTMTSSGSIAAMAVALTSFLPLPSTPLVRGPDWLGGVAVSPAQLFAIAVVVVLSAASYVGVRCGSLLQNFLSVAKIAAVLGLVAAGLWFGHGSWTHFKSATFALPATGLTPAIGAAAIGVLFSYSGWFACTYIAGEIKDPSRNIPRSLIAGTLLATGIYVLVNIVYLYALPIGELRGTVQVGEAAALRLFGGHISTVFTVVMIVTILGSLNSVILTSPRIYYAMARDRLFFQAIGTVHPRFQTPAYSLLLQTALAALLILTGSFAQLLAYVTTAMVLFSILSAAAVFVLRRRRPDLPRPYSLPGYPWVPAIFVGVYSCIFISLIVARPQEAGLGLATVAAGIPVYWLWNRRQPQAHASRPPAPLPVAAVAARQDYPVCSHKEPHETDLA
ncbi:APC family permease [Opitutus terrae]|uniref:Amino acid permease-associated region n=1 Tax=Opitutus terrae (strain DSM 11246 / JCM 15787 / PB90-1) TaxID=452637 RepID=B1ZZB6_OPITP|nr:amino acid permease [Opitutus terrae]ACB77188.1 amino acid permease-associated region [Opitutus terrae PB90-1]